MSELLLDWTVDPSPERGLTFARNDGGWDKVSYQELKRTVQLVAAGIINNQTAPRGRILLALPAPEQFAPAFFACLWAGCTPCPIAPPLFLRDSESYVRHVSALLTIAEPTLLIVDPTLRDPVAQALTNADCPSAKILEVGDLQQDDSSDAPEPAAELALLQFTSGSSGNPRGVMVSWKNLEQNIVMIRELTGGRVDVQGATWLPLYHDMGLIGCLVAAVTHSINLQIMRPEQFVLDPARWLECFGRYGAEFTAAPSFAFGYARRHVPDERLEGLDFSGWKAVIVGAERVDAEALSAFARWLAPYGFDIRTFQPAYGLAEATLAVSGIRLHQPPTAVQIASSATPDSGPVGITEHAHLPLPEGASHDKTWLVSCGRPLGQLDVDIVDSVGHTVPDGHVGQVIVRGETVAAGYSGGSLDGASQFAGEELLTGDAGFIHRGELYVLGRLGDSIKLRGKQIYMDDLERRLARLPGISQGKIAAFAGTDADGISVAVLVERDAGPWANDVEQLVRNVLGHEVLAGVLCTDRGGIARTSSGKPRRRVMWEAWRRGDLDAKPAALASDALTA